MGQLKWILGLLFISLASFANATEAYIGRFLYQYQGGNTYRVTVNDDKAMKWEALEGDEKGATGVETPQRFKVNNKVFFVTWVEKTGINVTQVLDLKNMKVYSTIIDGNERYVVKGNVIREK